MSATTFVGASGAAYSFADIEHQKVFPRTAGNFLYVGQRGDERIVLFVGDCDDLMAEAHERWPEAVSLGATRLYVRRNVSWRTRQQERDDLVQRFEPVMNEELRVATGTGGP